MPRPVRSKRRSVRRFNRNSRRTSAVNMRPVGLSRGGIRL